MAHNSIQFLRTKNIYASKEEAINKVKEIVLNNFDDFVDGESLLIKYYIDTDETSSVSSFVSIHIDDDETKTNEERLRIDFIINDRIVESEEAPTDTNALWLSNDEIEANSTNYIAKNEIESLKKEVQALKEMILRHDYDLTYNLGGGNFITTSVKYQEENSNTQEIPTGTNHDEIYASEDLTPSYFSLFIGKTNLSKYNGSTGVLYTEVKYFIKYKVYNQGDELLTNTGTLTLTSNSDNLWISDNIILASASGDTLLNAQLVLTDGTVLTKLYSLKFDKEEKPDYEYKDYSQLGHIFVKTASTYNQIVENINYLCLNELVWCEGNNSLYLKGKGPTGDIALYKINGNSGGEDDPEPDEPVIPINNLSVSIDDNGVLSISSTDNSVNVDENGILTINNNNVTVDENGILTINTI